MTTSLQHEIAVEQRHLDRVYARLSELRRSAERSERDGYRLARVGNLGALVERDAMVFHAARRRAALDAEHEGLVFGRLDRRGGAVQYVGRLGIRDAEATPLVIDWRAPAAADFYQATAADPRGVVRRRMIRSSRETVTGLDDDLLDPTTDLPAVGDGALLASLSRTTGHGMRDIVATIQREQDEAIRSPASGVTIVEGGPGTGKTAVALHRAAYLLYRDRARFAGGGVLVVGPSPVFVNYIATVLPSLGEQSATLRALGDLVEGVRATRVDPPALGAVKGSLRMLTVLRRGVRQQVPGAPTELRLAWRRVLLRVDGSTLERIRRQALTRHRGRNEVRRTAFDGIFDALWAEVTSQAPSYGKPRQEFEDEISDRPDFRDFLRAWWPLLRPAQVLAWPADPARLRRLGDGVLTRREVAALAGSFAELDAHGPTVADVALLDELDALLGRPFRARRRPRRKPRQATASLPRLNRLGPDGRPMNLPVDRSDDDLPEDQAYAHVVVDEAQDVSPMQWRMLGRRGRHASWTVVGDPAQSAWTGDPAELARARDAALRGRPDALAGAAETPAGSGAGQNRGAGAQATALAVNRYTLTTNYRNSVEIFELAASVIRTVAPDTPLPTAVRATGVPPEQRVVSERRSEPAGHERRSEPAGHDLAAAVRTAAAELLGQVEGTVGVITPVARRDEVAGWLKPDRDDRLQVVTSLEAKGMEYDGVVLVEPAQIVSQSDDRDAGHRTLYVALSRATQRLVTVATARW